MNEAAPVREEGGGEGGGECTHIGVWDFAPEQSISLYRWFWSLSHHSTTAFITSICSSDFGHLIGIEITF